MISPPEYHYRLETLTFPVMTLSGEGRSSGDVRGTMRTSAPAQSWFPIRGNETRSNPLEQGTVLIRVESRYCAGWEAFFRQRSDGQIKKPCGEDGSITLDLTVPFRLDAESPVVTTEINPSGNGTDGGVPDGWQEGVVAPSVSPEVESQLGDCTGGDCDPPPDPDMIGPGNYTVSPSNTYSLDGATFETDGGDVTLAIDGDVQLDDVDVTGDGNVTLYVRDELSVDGNVNDGGNASQFVSLVHSEGSVRFNGDSAYTGLIYAPKSTTSFNGNPAISYEGALVTEVFELNGNLDKLDFESSEDLDDYQILSGERPITYLHVSENPIEVEFD
jgi:hypothetical protein